MGINDNYLSLSSYRVNEIPRVYSDAIRPAQNGTDEKPANAANLNEQPKEERKEIVNANINDISLSFNINENFGYIGRDRDENMLDMQKAAAEAQSDNVLRDYQYFVGDRKPIYESEDGSVFAL